MGSSSVANGDEKLDFPPEASKRALEVAQMQQPLRCRSSKVSNAAC